METTLTAEEQAYFDTRGATAPEPAKEAPEKAPEAPEEVEATAEPDDAGEAEADAPDDVGGEDDRKQKVVSHKALHAERERRKAAEKELQELREFRIRMEERAKWAQEAQAKREAEAAKPSPEPEPDPDEDIFGAVKHDREHTRAELQALREKVEQQEKARQAEQETRQVIAAYQAKANEFKAQTEDFDAAYQHLYKSRDEELQELGWNDPAARMRQIEQEEYGIAVQALQQGRNPAEAVYRMARARGYQRSAPAAPAPDVEKAKAASRTLSGTGGNPTGPMTAERLSKMSATEFMAYEDRHPEVVKRLLQGQK